MLVADAAGVEVGVVVCCCCCCVCVGEVAAGLEAPGDTTAAVVETLPLVVDIVDWSRETVLVGRLIVKPPVGTLFFFDKYMQFTTEILANLSLAPIVRVTVTLIRQACQSELLLPVSAHFATYS